MSGIDMEAIIKSLHDTEAFTDEQLELLEAAGEELLTYGEDEFIDTINIPAVGETAANVTPHFRS